MIKKVWAGLAVTLALLAGAVAPASAGAPSVTAVGGEVSSLGVVNIKGSPVKGGVDAPKGNPFRKAAGGVSSKLVTCPNYEYAAGAQTFSGGATVGGFGANAMVTKPFLNSGATGCHSLVELAVQGGSTYGDIVEVGATVDKTVNSGCTPNPACLDEPHLFVYHWVNGATTCYNGCGWVDDSSNPINAGSSLASVASAAFPANVKQFNIQYMPAGTCGAVTGAWVVGYAGLAIGCFPKTLWTAPTFTSGTRIQAFWEVASTGTVDCSDEGQQGRQGSAAVLPLDASDPAYIGSITLTNPSPAATANVIPFVSPGSGSGYSVQGFASGGNTRTITGGGTGTDASGNLPGNANSC